MRLEAKKERNITNVQANNTHTRSTTTKYKGEGEGRTHELLMTLCHIILFKVFLIKFLLYFY